MVNTLFKMIIKTSNLKVKNVIDLNYAFLKKCFNIKCNLAKDETSSSQRFM